MGLYFAQLILCYAAIMFVAWPLSIVLHATGLTGENPAHIYFAGYQALLCLFVGPIVGWLAGKAVPPLVPSGRWTWLIPAPVLIVSMVNAIKAQSLPWLPEELFITGSNEGLSVVFLTLPACSALGYSIGMLLLGRLQGTSTNRASRSLLRPLVSVGIGIALFTLSVVPLREFEQATLKRWSKLRHVIDPSGLRFSSDPALLCADPLSPALSIVRPALVESLGSQICQRGHLLQPGDSPERNSFSVEKVRILDGSRTGNEVWVPSYGAIGNHQAIIGFSKPMLLQHPASGRRRVRSSGCAPRKPQTIVKALGLYATCNVITTFLVYSKLGCSPPSLPWAFSGWARAPKRPRHTS